MKVSCVIPAYNEAARIGAVVRAARACPLVHEVIVVSDGSSDETARYAAEAGAHRVITLPQNQGKGGAVLTALPQAGGEILLLLDADLCGLRAVHLSELLAPVLAGEAEMTIGLFTDDPLHGMMRRLSGQRAIRRSLLRNPDGLAGTGFGFDLALDRLARRQRARVASVLLRGVTHRGKREKYGTVKGLRQELRNSSDLLRLARRAMSSRRPASRKRPAPPRAEKENPRSMVLAVALITLLLILVAPVFLARPSHAARVSAASPLQPGDRLLIVVAHPDDEVIGAGGLVATASRAGVPVTVLILTNGDSNRMSAALIGHRLRPGPADFIKTGQVRQREALAALGRLGVPPERVSFLGFPDRLLPQVLASNAPVTSPFTRLSRATYLGVLAADTPYTGPALRGLIAQVIRQSRATVIITHAPFDRHGDHQVVYTLVRPLIGNARLYAFLVHAPGFPRPLRFAPKETLRPPSDLARPAGWAWVEYTLSAEAQRNKHQALDAHRSQLETPYLRLLLTGFVRTNELFAIPREPSEAFGMTR